MEKDEQIPWVGGDKNKGDEPDEPRHKKHHKVKTAKEKVQDEQLAEEDQSEADS